MQQDLETTAPPTGHFGSAGNAVHGRGAYQSEFRRVVKELDGVFAKFRRLLHDEQRHPDSESIRIKLGALKRDLSDHLPVLLQGIGPALVELEFRRPGISSAFYEIWLDPPQVIQGPTTWLQYLGRWRAFLIEAIGPEPARAEMRAAAAQDHAAAPLTLKELVPLAGGSKETEPHYTVKQLAERWGLDQSTVRRIFRDEPDVLRIPHLRRRGKRDYVSLRIPASVAARVHERRSRSLFKI